ncbi:aldolase [Mesobacillus foraminis]|uniref:aldolase n=1 Tax=Mesobacillus foraminis TaxID=279826 RepID=UPI000EF4B26A|nr:aldolase [Mesobacillus foraminis]
MEIASEIKLPELPTKKIDTKQVDVKVELKPIADLEELESNPYYHFVKNNIVMFNVPGIANFLIQGGSTITVSPFDELKEGVARLYILGTCMGVILMQRKVLPLHGSAMVINGNAYAIVGESGAGKSTLASAFINKGFKLLSDDIIPVTILNDGTLTVIPSYPQQKLWQESLNNFGMEPTQFQPIYERETKFAVPVPANFSNEPIPLKGIFELVLEGEGDIKLSRVKGLQRIYTLFNHTYRNFIIPRLDQTEWHFDTTVKIINEIEMYRLSRPPKGFTADKLCSAILKVIEQEEIVC